MGDFPQGEAEPNTQDDDEVPDNQGDPGAENPDGSVEESNGSELEPGFGSESGDNDGLPDLRDEPSLEDTLESFEHSTDQAAGDAGDSGESNSGSTGTTGVQNRSLETRPGGTAETGSRAGDGYATGARTSAEQTKILSDELERQTGEFDAMIRDQQAAQRRATRQQTTIPDMATASAQSDSGDSTEIDIDTHETSSGGGLGGRSDTTGGAGIPQNTAKYPPPSDIPMGNDDDVVARQLREAAMREPDPELRQKLWQEYRKYKGVSH